MSLRERERQREKKGIYVFVCVDNTTAACNECVCVCLCVCVRAHDGPGAADSGNAAQLIPEENRALQRRCSADLPSSV